MTARKAAKPDVTERAFRLIKKHGKISIPQIAKLMRMKPNSVTYHVNLLHEAKRIHVSEWTGFHRPGKHVRLWSIGDAPDEEFPIDSRFPIESRPEETQAERWERMMIERDRANISRLAAKIQPFRHPQDVAFFGAAA